MVGIDEFFTHRRCIRQYPQPTEWVDTLELLENPVRNCLARHTMEPITTCDVVTVQANCHSIMIKGNVRSVGFHIVRLYIRSAIIANTSAGASGLH
ncbi:hypothetical protein D3C73_1464690 [compost metagenome]